MPQQADNPQPAMYRPVATQQTPCSPDTDDDLFVPLAFAQRIATAAGATAQIPSATYTLPGATASLVSNTSMPDSLSLPLCPDHDDQVYDVPDLDPGLQAKPRWPSLASLDQSATHLFRSYSTTVLLRVMQC